MKKLLLMSLIGITTVFTTACENQEVIYPSIVIPPSDEELYEGEALRVKQLLNEIVFDNEIDSDFNLLPSIGEYELTWFSNNEAITIDNDNDIALVNRTYANVDVDLKAETLIGDIVVSKEFDVLVEQLEMPNIENYFDDPLFVMNYLEEKLDKETNYHLHSYGNSLATIKIFYKNYNINQEITMNKYKYSDVMYLEVDSLTKEAPFGLEQHFINESYFDNGNIGYYTAKSEEELLANATPKHHSEETYIDTYGILPTDKEFSGHIVDVNTVLSSKYNGCVDNIHEFVYEIAATDEYILRTRKYGQLDGVEMKSSKLSIYIDSNWNLISFDQIDVYNGDLSIYTTEFSQKITTTFNYINEIDVINNYPQIQLYKSFLEERDS